MLPWAKPPVEITCPKCGAIVPTRRSKSSTVQPKPYCNQCGWNVDRARTQLIAEFRQTLAAAALFAAYAWAMFGNVWIAAAACVWPFAAVSFQVIAQLRRLPKTSSVVVAEPAAGISDFNLIRLEAVAPRLNIVVEALITIVAAAAILYFPYELNPHRRKLPAAHHEVLFVALTICLAAYQLVAHGLVVYRLLKAVWVEQQLANGAMSARGVVRESNSGVLEYDFIDYRNQAQSGTGRDYSMALYEGMPVSVLYDPEAPSLNLPVVGLQFHRPQEAAAYSEAK